jgi:nucleotide-binding universal stress UspA family protein
MKALIGIDRSRCSQYAIENVCRRQWPTGSEIELLAVLHSGVPFLPDPTFMLAAAYEHDKLLLENAAPYLLDDAASRIRAACPALRVTTRVVEGSPAETIVAEARRWGADVIVVGSHRRGFLRRLLRGSVSRAVSRRATCPVQVVTAPLRVH